MGKHRIRVLRAGLATVFATALLGCTSTVNGVAVMATQPADADGVVVALLDTGKYPTTASHPVGTAGSESSGALLEAQRMAEYVVGPWEVNAKLRESNFASTQAAPDVDLLKIALEELLPGPVLDIAAAHGIITTFATSRYSHGSQSALTNVVMRFPDPGAAAAASAEMAAKNAQIEDPPRSPIAIENYPEAAASAHDALGEKTVVDSFTAWGPYVLYQDAQSRKSSAPDLAPEAALLVEFVLGHQEKLLDQFAATDPAKLANLPLDPTGKLLARTLPTSDLDAAFVAGVWQPRAWLHFEDDPIAAAAWYAAAGVEAVAKGLTTVYQTHNPGGAARLAQQLASNPGPGVKPTTGVPGLPTAKCFSRQHVAAAPTTREMGARFKCVAHADRYTFIAYSDKEKDVKQQTAAQYRILAGK
ncbi:hypothetical protein H7K24_00145 [Mycobacterium fragae]|uniref:Uncharacterized protein n=1 Tax=Mycobacterium fragae TaxID=1260918 RepID=A0A1X1ULX3_9MYCO|nr:hypothetical protein [Mycobacterium fragae]MCV7398570.1 hypothetical protein [Mycobacterium fragae]ORV57836.1 hypothetical protein AWC06_21060 [Mycobacterium fragae]